MRKNKIIALMLTTLLIFCNLISNVYSANDTPINVIIGSAQGIPGGDITVPVNFKNVPSKGINSCDFRLEYDSSVFDITSVDYGEIVVNPVANFFSYTGKLGYISLLYNDNSQGSNPIKNEGVFAYIRLKLKNDAAAGSYQIKLDTSGSFADIELNTVPSSFVLGSISVPSKNVSPTVMSATPTQTPTLTPTLTPSPTIKTESCNIVIGSTQGSAGQTVTVPVNFQDVPEEGINNCDFGLSYDSNIFEVIGINPGSIVVNPDSNFTVNTMNTGKIQFCYNDKTQDSGSITNSGIFANISLKIKAGAAAGNYQFKLSSLGSFDDKDFIDINVTFTEGIIKVIASADTDTPTVTPTDTPTDTPTVTPTDTPTATTTSIPQNINVVLGTVQGTAGQTVTVPVSFQGVPEQGLNNCDFRLSYDTKVFEVVSVDPGSIVVNPTNNFYINAGNSGNILFLYNDATQNSGTIYSSGLFANINLRIKADAAAGSYQIKLSSLGSFADKNLSNVNAAFNSATITVIASSLSPTPTSTPSLSPTPTAKNQNMSIVIGSAEGSADQIVTIPVNFQEVPAEGINNCDFKISYDADAFEVVGVDPGSIVVNPTANFKYYSGNPGYILFLYNDETQSTGAITDSGLFANINLKVKNGTEVKKHQIFTSSIGEFADKSLLLINVTSNTGTITVLKSDLSTPTSTPTPTATPTPLSMDVEVGSVQGSANQTVTVPVYFKGVPEKGINSCDFKLKYNKNIFEVIGIDPGSIVVNSTNNFLINSGNEGEISFLYSDTTQKSGSITTSGLFANIKLKIKSGAAAGNYQIKSSVGSFADENLETIDAIFNVGTVTVLDNTKDLNIVIGSAQGYLGETVTVPVSFLGVPEKGINNCDFKLSYDTDIFEVANITAGDIVTNASNNFSVNKNTPGNLLFLFNDATQGSNAITSDGVFANVSLKIKDDAKEGDFQIKFSSIGSFADKDLNSINAVSNSGIATVIKASPEFSMNIGNVQGSAGQIITVPVSLKNIPTAGINSCDFKVAYDSNIFDIVSIDSGSIITDPVVNFGSYKGNLGNISFLFNDYTQGSNSLTEDGLFANISLKIKSGVVPGIYNIKVSSIGTFADKDLNDLNIVQTDGKVTIS